VHYSIDCGGKYALRNSLTYSKALKGDRIASPSIPAEHRMNAVPFDWEILREEFARPIVLVSENPRFVKFWKNVCGDGTEFSSVVKAGKKFVSPWASLGFKGLLNSLILSAANPDDCQEGDMDLLEMQEALEDYIKQHTLFSQALSAAKLASRLPWLLKYKFLDALPQPIHSMDLLHRLGTTSGPPQFEDISTRHPHRFIIGTLLIAGHLLDTRFNHWRTENTDMQLAETSSAASARKSFHRWELRKRKGKFPWGTRRMLELDEVGKFLGRQLYTKSGIDIKFRNPGLNTSYWEAALVGPVPKTAAHAVLGPQKPCTATVGATVVSVSSLWFAKVRACDLFGSRSFTAPYNDFPFPNKRVHSTFLNEIEKRVAYAQKAIPAFDLVKILFGRNNPTTAFQRAMMTLAPDFPSRNKIRSRGKFQDRYLSRESINDIIKIEDQAIESVRQSQSPEGAQSDESIDTDKEIVDPSVNRETDTEVVQRFVADGWRPTDSDVEGEVIVSPEGAVSAFHAFISAMRITGTQLSLENVVEIAKNEGWDEDTTADFHELGVLGEHFGVEITLETGNYGCFQYPAKGKRGVARVSLVALKDQFGYLPERCKERGSARRRLRFAEMLD